MMLCSIYKIYKIEFRKGVGITINSKETSTV